MTHVYVTPFSSFECEDKIYTFDYVQEGIHQCEIMMGKHHDFFFADELTNEQLIDRYQCDEVLDCFRTESFDGHHFTSSTMLVYRGEWIYPVKEIWGDMFTVGIGPVYDIKRFPLDRDSVKGFFVVDGELRFC